jgi:hypothetical protein
VKTIYVVVELSIDEDVDPQDVADTLFNFLVATEDLPEVIFSVDGAEIRHG